MFRKKIEPNCTYCKKSTVLSDGNVICRHFGLIEPRCECRRFEYAPLKRIPTRPPLLPEYDRSDFSI